MRKFSILVIALMLMQGSCFVGMVEATTPTPTPFVDGDRVMFVGDSITHYGLYHMYIMEYYATRYPSRNIKFINDGIAGDSALGVLGRIDADIAANNPTKVVMMIGMNDFSRTSTALYPPTSANEAARVALLDSYESRVSQIVDKIKNAGIEVVLLTPSTYDETMLPLTSGSNVIGYNTMLSEAGTRLKNIASVKNVPVIDFNTDMTQINNTLQASSPTSTIIGSDRIHPGQNGHNLMAYLFLKAQGFSGIVSDVEINYTTGIAAKNTNANITGIVRYGSILQYHYTPQSLPILADSYYNTVSGWGVNMTGEINQELLKITNVPVGSYRMKMDGVSVGEYTQSQLASGINLATLANNPAITKLTAIRAICSDKYNTEIKLRDLAFTLVQMAAQGYTDIGVYYTAKYAGMDAFNKARLDNAVYASSNSALIRSQIAEKEAALSAAAVPALIEMELTDQPDVLPSPTPDISKSILFESFDSFPVQQYTLPTTQNGWSMSCGEATTAKMQVKEQEDNKYFELSRISAPSSSNMPIIEKSFTAQSGIFIVEADLAYPAGTEQVYLRLSGANNNGGGRGWVPAVGISLSSIGALTAFNQLDGTGTGTIASSLDETSFQHLKVEVNVPKQVFKVYVNGSSTAATNPRTIPNPNTKNRTAEEWDFRESGIVTWSNINKIDICIAPSTNVGSTGKLDNIWIYDEDVYYGTLPTPTPDISKSLLFESFDSFPVQQFALPATQNGWSMSCGEATSAKIQTVQQDDNQYLEISRISAPAANNMPVIEKSFTAQTGIFTVETDLKYPAGTEQVYLRLTGANNNGGGRGWVPAVGISLSQVGTMSAFNQLDGTGSGVIATVTDTTIFHHIKVEVNVPKQVFKVYVDGSTTPAPNPRAIPNPNTKGRTAEEWDFRESGIVTWTNINKVDICLGTSKTIGCIGAVDNIWIYDPVIYYSPTPTPTPDASLSVLYESFDGFPVQEYPLPTMQSGWSMTSGEATTVKMQTKEQNGNRFFELSRISSPTANNVPTIEKSFTAQTGVFIVEADIQYPAGTEQVFLRLTGANNNGGGRGWVPAVGINLSYAGTIAAFNQLDGTGSGNVITGLDSTIFQHIKIEVNVPKQVFKVYINGSSTAATNPRAIPNPNTKNRTAEEWDFRESGIVTWTNINKVDICLGSSMTVGCKGAVDNVWIYDYNIYY